MNRSLIVYALLLLGGLGASWQRFTSDQAPVKDGVAVYEAKADDLKKVVYTSPDLTVTYEVRKDDHGSYGWVTLTEIKKKKGADGVETSETKITRFKSGENGEKLVETWSPLLALRHLEAVTDDQISGFGLKEPDSTVTVTVGAESRDLEVGGETYGAKDRYVRDRKTGQVYVIAKDTISTLRFARTKLKDNELFPYSKEELAGVSVGQGAASASWSQKNIDDRAVAYWERDGAAKDETFNNWLDKALKLRSTDYVQEGEEPAELLSAFDLTFRPVEGKPVTVQVLRSGEDWYARSEHTRALVRVNKTSANDISEEVDDVIEGRAPPPKEEPTGVAPGAPPAPTTPPLPEGAEAPPAPPTMPPPGAGGLKIPGPGRPAMLPPAGKKAE